MSTTSFKAHIGNFNRTPIRIPENNPVTTKHGRGNRLSKVVLDRTQAEFLEEYLRPDSMDLDKRLAENFSRSRAQTVYNSTTRDNNL
jgi:hypothetical protein